MAQQYKTGLIITGDASGGIRAVRATDDELGKLNQTFDRTSRQSKRLGTDVKQTGRQLSTIDRGATEASRGLAVLRTNATGVAAALATAFGAGSIINQARLIADTDALAKSIGMSTGELQAWDYAAKLAGLSGGQMGDILKDVAERIGEFSAEGTGEAAALFENLNLRIEEMQRLAPDQQLLKIAEAISTLDNRGEQISYLERLGNDATRLLPLLENNAALLREYTNEADALGVSMSNMDIESAIEANRAMAQLSGTAQGLTNQIVADLGPGLATVTSSLTDFIQESGGAASILNEVKDVATLTAAVMAGRYAASIVASTRQMIERNAASAAAAAADERSMQMAVRRAAAEVATEKRLLGRAIAEAQATKGTDAHAAALARLGAARQRAVAATAQHTVAVNANASATQRATVAARAASSAYALIGGPLGVATLAATAFFMFRDSSDDVSTSLVSLEEPLEDVISSFKELTAESQQAALIRWGDRQEEEADKARRALSKIREEILSLGFENTTGAEAREFFDEVSAGFEAVESGAQSLDGMLTRLQEQLEIPDSVMRDLRLLAADYSEGRLAADELGSRLVVLTSTFSDVGDAAAETGSQINANTPSTEALDKWEQYNQKLRESVAALNDPSAAGAAARELDALGIVDPIRRATTLVLAAQQDQIERQKEFQKEAADAARTAASEAQRAAQEQVRAAENHANALVGIQQEMDPLLKDYEIYLGRLDTLDRALAEGTITEERYGAALRWSAEQYKRSATGAEEYEKELKALVGQYDRQQQKAKQLAADERAIQQAFDTNAISAQQYARMMAEVEEAQYRLALESEGTFAAMATAWNRSVERMDDAGKDFWRGWLDGTGDAVDQFKNIVMDGVAEVAHALITRPLTVGLTADLQGMLGIGAGGQQGAGGGLNFSNTIGAAKNLYSSGAALLGGGASTAAAGYSAGTFAGSATGAYGGWAGSAAAGAAQAGGGFMGAASATMPWVGGALLADNVLGLGIVDGIVSGISGLFGGGETPFSGRFGTTATLNRSEGAGKDGVFEHQSTGRFYGESALGFTGFRDQGTKRLQRAGTGDKDWAEELTNAAVEMDNLVASIARSPEELDLMRSAVQGLETSSRSAADIVEFALNERPRAALEAMGGDFGQFVQGLSGSIEEVVQQAQVAQQAHDVLASGMERLNLQFDATGAGAFEAAGSIADMVGGIENLTSLQSNYFDNFLSEGERAAYLQNDLAKSLATIGMQLPETRSGYRDLVEAQNLNTAAGQRNYAQLLQLAPAFADLVTDMGDVQSAAERLSSELSAARDVMATAEDAALKAWQAFDSQSYDQQRQLLALLGDSEAALAMERERELATIDESLRPHQLRIWALEDEYAAQQKATQAAQNYVSELSRVRGELSNTLGNISGWIDQQNATGGTPGMNLAESGDQFSRQLELAQSGDRAALQSITQYADQYLSAGEAMFASGGAFQSIQEEVLGALEALPDQISSEEYLAEEIRTALFDALEGKATDSEINALMARVVDGDLSIESALASIYGTSEGTEDNTKTLEDRAREQLNSLDGLVSEMSRTTDQFVGLNSTMVSLKDSINALGVAQAEVAKIEKARIAAEKAERERIEQERKAAQEAAKQQQAKDLVSEGSAVKSSLGAFKGSAKDSVSREYDGWADSFENLWDYYSARDLAKLSDGQFEGLKDERREGHRASGADWAYGNTDTIANAIRDMQESQQSLAGLRQEYKALTGKAAPFAKGGVFTNSIVSEPTHFNMGLMGEAGPEAIVPLHMGSDGLGIKDYGPRDLPMPDMPLPQFPQLGNADVVQVLNDLRNENKQLRSDINRLLGDVKTNTGNTANAVASSASRAEQQRIAQLEEQRAATSAARLKVRTP
ncbi:hypothetical protein [Vreelandella sp. H-I2]